MLWELFWPRCCSSAAWLLQQSRADHASCFSSRLPLRSEAAEGAGRSEEMCYSKMNELFALCCLWQQEVGVVGWSLTACEEVRSDGSQVLTCLCRLCPWACFYGRRNPSSAFTFFDLCPRIQSCWRNDELPCEAEEGEGRYAGLRNTNKRYLPSSVCWSHSWVCAFAEQQPVKFVSHSAQRLSDWIRCWQLFCSALSPFLPLHLSEVRCQLVDQLKVLDLQLEQKTQQLQDMTDYLRRRGEIESEYARSLEKLAERFTLRIKR